MRPAGRRQGKQRPAVRSLRGDLHERLLVAQNPPEDGLNADGDQVVGEQVLTGRVLVGGRPGQVLHEAQTEVVAEVSTEAENLRLSDSATAVDGLRVMVGTPNTVDSGPSGSGNPGRGGDPECRKRSRPWTA